MEQDPSIEGVRMKIFIAGATGVIGRRAVPLLLAAGHAVSAVGRSPDSRRLLASHGATALDVDLCDARALRPAIAGHDVVINLATHIPPSSAKIFFARAWRENDRLRKHASAALVDASLASGVTRYVQESFAPVYPDNGDRWIDESVPLRPVRYNRTVLDAENSAERFARGGGAYVILRFGAFYGVDALQTRDLVAYVKRGWVPLPGKPTAYMSSVCHEDAATAVAAALSVPAGAYNVVDDEPLTHADFAGSLARLLGAPPPRFPPAGMEFLLGSLGRMLARSLRISNAKLRGASDWRPRFASAREGWPAVVAGLRESAQH
jgi:nucleoside-diphosphate-sugar epimerase